MPDSPHPSRPPRQHTTRAMVFLASAMLMSSLGTSIANIALPTLVETFRSSVQAVQWVVLAYLLAVTVLVVSVGRLGDLIGRRRLMMAGIALFTIASVACATSTQLWMLITARAVQGLGAAVLMALAVALATDLVPPTRSGIAMGFLGTTSALGTALGPSLGGLLIAGWGWPAIFLVNVPLGISAFALALRLPPDAPRHARPDFDLRGSTLLAVTLTAYALAMTLGKGHAGLLNLVLLIAAALGAALFLRMQKIARSPLVHPHLLRNETVRAGIAMSSLTSAVAMTTLVVGPFYLSGALHLAPAATGLVMTIGPLVAALAGVPAGRSADRFGSGPMTLLGLGLMTLGTLGLAVISPDLGIPAYVVPLAATTAGFAVFQAANNTAVIAGVDASQRGVTSGLLNLSRNLGLITGASVMGAIFAARAGSLDASMASVEAIAAGTHAAFAAALLALGFSALVALRAPGPASLPSPRT